MMHAELSALLMFGAAWALWSWAARGRELVDRISDRICRESDLQRLDQSLTLRRISFGPRGQRWSLQRIYAFEYSGTGSDRRLGEISLLNSIPRWARLHEPDGMVHIDLH